MASQDLPAKLLRRDLTLRYKLLTRVQKDLKYLRVERRLDPHWADSYWKTGSPCASTIGDWRRCLTKHQFYYKTSERETKLRARAARCAQGLPFYDRHNVKELAALVRDRGLSVITSRSMSTKKQLIQKLRTQMTPLKHRENSLSSSNYRRNSETACTSATSSHWVKYHLGSFSQHSAELPVSCDRRLFHSSSSTAPSSCCYDPSWDRLADVRERDSSITPRF